jgi:hypothetical protein
MNPLAVHTNEELLDVYLAAKSLASLHSKPGGLELSRREYEQRADGYRREILRRMEQQ